MTEQALDTYLKEEIAAFPGKASILVAEVESGRVLWALEPDTQVVSASTIKVPVLLSALEEVRQGRLSLGQTLDLPAEVLLEDSKVFEYGPTSRSLWELLYWMIVESDNTATNRVISTVGYDAINAYARDVLGLRHTVCQRQMLDWDAIAAGRNNYTSAADQFALYRKLCRGGDFERVPHRRSPGHAPPPAVHGRHPALQPLPRGLRPQDRRPGLPEPRRRRLFPARRRLVPGHLHLGRPQRRGG